MRTHVLHKIEVAQAFDELSILEIKKNNLINRDRRMSIKEQICLLRKEIITSIGFDLMEQIYHSNFYSTLFNTNSKIFEYINKLDWGKAAEFNRKRFEAKKVLQEHFLGKKLKEIKILKKNEL